MGTILGPITHVEIDGQDVTDCIASVSFTGIDASVDPPACDWDMVVDAYNRLTGGALGEPAPGRQRVIDQDGNPVRPHHGWLRNLGSS